MGKLKMEKKAGSFIYSWILTFINFNFIYCMCMYLKLDKTLTIYILNLY
jgi:hypothetical protein